MQLISKYDKKCDFYYLNNRFLLCFTDNINKYAWVFSSKDKIGITIANVFQTILHDASRHYSWVNKG